MLKAMYKLLNRIKGDKFALFAGGNEVLRTEVLSSFATGKSTQLPLFGSLVSKLLLMLVQAGRYSPGYPNVGLTYKVP